MREGHNLQHFCREALRHVRNLLVVRVSGTASELAEAAGREPEQLLAAAQPFAEEDLLRFFQVLLQTENQLRRSPQPRLHLELGLLRLVEAERLAPLEELLTQLSGNPAPAPRVGPRNPGARTPAGTAPEIQPAATVPAAPPRASESLQPSVPRAVGLGAEQIERIKAAVYERSKFLGSFVDQVDTWQWQNSELTLWFAPENRTLAQMLDSKQQETLSRILSEVLGEKARVAVKLGKTSSRPAGAMASAEQRARNHPVVQALYERLGGNLRVEDLSQPGNPTRGEREE